jgi:hypothetical protein
VTHRWVQTTLLAAHAAVPGCLVVQWPDSPDDLSVIRVEISPTPLFNDAIATCGPHPDEVLEPGATLTYAWSFGPEQEPFSDEQTVDLSPHSLIPGMTVGCGLTVTNGRTTRTGHATSFIADRPPVLQDVAIFPVDPTTIDTLVPSYTVNDPDGTETFVSVNWVIRREGESPNSVASTQLPSVFTRKHDEVDLVVTVPYDPAAPLVQTATTTIQNTPPTAATLSMSREDPRVTEWLECMVVDPSYDPDGDVVAYTFTWTLDGEPFTASAEETLTSSLHPSVLAAGQRWRCEVTPNDGEVNGPISAVEVEIPYRWVTVPGGGAVGENIITIGEGAVVTGHYVGTAVFDDITFPDRLLPNGFVTHIDKNGHFTWATVADSKGTVVPRAIGATTDGGAVITGYYEGDEVTLGPITLPEPGGWGVFAAKVNADGEFVWATSTAGGGYGIGYSVDGHPDGSAVVAGTIDGTLLFGDHGVTTAGGSEVFVAKTTAEGAWAWTSQSSSSVGSSANGVATTTSGDIVVTGPYSGTLTLGSHSLEAAIDTNAFVARLTSEGNVEWLVRLAADGYLATLDIAALPDGAAIVTGHAYGSATFGELTVVSDDWFLFVAKIGTDGETQWVATALGTREIMGASVQVGPDETSVVTGFFSDRVNFGDFTFVTALANNAGFLVVLDADGNFVWGRQTDSEAPSFGIGATFMADGQPLWLGHFNGQSYFDNASRSPSHAGTATFLWKPERP